MFSQYSLVNDTPFQQLISVCVFEDSDYLGCDKNIIG